MRVAQEIMSEYQHQMVSLTLLPGDKGIFDVKVNGTLIYSKHAKGRFPEPGEIRANVSTIIE